MAPVVLVKKKLNIFSVVQQAVVFVPGWCADVIVLSVIYCVPRAYGIV